MIHTSLSPNAEFDDVILSFRSILWPFNWKKGSNVGEAEFLLAKKLLGKKGNGEKADDLINTHIRCVDSGRTALYTILKSYGVGSGDEVIVQAYTCVAVPGPVLWVGATPIYVDVNADFTMDTDDLIKKITNKTKAIVVQHTFGRMADMEKIMSVASKKKIVVIEDCAHSFYSTNLGDASFNSFGRDKFVSSVFGGSFIIKDKEIFAKANILVDSYSEASSLWIFKQLMHPVILSISKQLYNFLSLGKVILELSKRLRLISKAVYKVELSGGKPEFVFHKYPNVLAGLLIKQLSKLEKLRDHRIEIVKYYDRELSKITEIFVPTLNESSPSSFLRYTLIFKNKKLIKEFWALAKENKVILGDWYDKVIAPQGVDFNSVNYIVGSCVNAEYLSEHTVNLPTHIGISLEDAKYIVDILKTVLNNGIGEIN